MPVEGPMGRVLIDLGSDNESKSPWSVCKVSVSENRLGEGRPSVSRGLRRADRTGGIFRFIAIHRSRLTRLHSNLSERYASRSEDTEDNDVHLEDS